MLRSGVLRSIGIGRAGTMDRRGRHPAHCRRARRKGGSEEQRGLGHPGVSRVCGPALSVVGLMTPTIAVIFQESGWVTVVIISTLLLWLKGRPATA